MATAEKQSQVGEKQNTNSLLSDALNNRDFVAYLEKTGEDAEAINPENPDAAKNLYTRLKAFENIKIAKTEVRAFAKGKFREINNKFKLDDKDFTAVDAAIEKMAIENPEEAAGLVGKLREFQKLETEAKEAEAQFLALDKDSGKFWEEGIAMGLRASKEAKREPSGREKAWLVGKFLRKKNDEERSFEKTYGIKVEEAEEKLKTIQEAKDKVSAAQTLARTKANELGALKEYLMEDAGILKGLRDEIALKISKRSVEILEGTPRLSDLEEERTMRATFSNGELADTFNLADELSDDPERDLKHIDDLIEARIYEDMKVEIAKPWGSRPLDDMKKSLKTFREKSDIMGKKGQEAKEVIISTMERIRDERPAGDLRRTFINVMILEMRNAA